MDINLDLLKQELIRDEGLEKSAYKDSNGYLTIGVGHLIDARKNGTLPDSIIDLLLNYDIQKKLQDAQTHLWYRVLDTDNRHRAVLNMVFNLGSMGVCKLNNFTLLLEEKKWAQAAEDLRHTLWYTQVKDRAERICELIEKG